MLGFMMIGEDFIGSLTTIQMERELRALGCEESDIEELRTVGLRKFNEKSEAQQAALRHLVETGNIQ